MCANSLPAYIHWIVTAHILPQSFCSPSPSKRTSIELVGISTKHEKRESEPAEATDTQVRARRIVSP